MFMKTVMIPLILVATITGTAHAADILIPEEPIAPDPGPAIDTRDWGGFYIGAYGGYNWITAGVSGSTDVDAEGLKGGVYTGFNQQFDNDVVLGIEAIGGLGDISDTNVGTTIDQQWDASVRGRMGYAFDQSMFYGFAGLGATSVEATTAAGSDTQTLTGWNVGAGLETQLADNLTARFEYGFSDYSDESFSLGGGTTNIDLTDQGVLLGLGLKF